MSAAKRENRRVIRIHLDEPLKIILGSIGVNVRYEMLTNNISSNGFFLNFEKPGRFPFTPSSIMEVWLELGNGETIFFNGKMARVVYESDPIAVENGPGIAVRIVQIDSDNELKLTEYIDTKVDEMERVNKESA